MLTLSVSMAQFPKGAQGPVSDAYGPPVSGTLDFEARSTAIIGQLQGKISTVVRESVIST